MASSALSGLFVGAALWGVISDRIGRRRAFQATLWLFGIFTGLAAFTWNPPSMAFATFFAGIGIGGEIPLSYTILGEYMPARNRGKIQVSSSAIWETGAVAAGLTSLALMPMFGWRALFLVGATPALVLAILARHYVPESIRFLIAHGEMEKAAQIMNRMETSAGIQPTELASTRSDIELDTRSIRPATPKGIGGLWKNYRRRTLLTWTLYFASFITYYGIATWLPTLLVGEGYALVRSIAFTTGMIAAAIVGEILVAILIDFVGRKPLLIIFFSLAGTSIMLFGLMGSSMGIAGLMLSGSLSFFFVRGSAGALHAFVNESYPTEWRMTGHGLAQACGRAGAMFGPAIVGFVMGAGGQVLYALLLFGTLNFVGAALMLTLGYETKGKTLEAISPLHS
jgi:putative MFS transporter